MRSPRFFLSIALSLLVLTSLRADPGAAVRAHVGFLSDDLLEGRAAGTRGYAVAARYVAAVFAAAGLRPAGTEGWFQTVPLREARALPEGASIRIERADGSHEALQYGADFAPFPGFHEASVTVRAPAVFVGFGIEAPELNLDDLREADLRGKIAVVLAGAPESLPPNPRAVYSDRTAKYRSLAERGAVAVLWLSTPQDEARYPWAFRLNSSRFPGMRWLDSSGEPRDAPRPLRAILSLSPAGAARLFAEAPKPLDAVFSDAAAGELLPLELGTVELTVQTELRDMESVNVLAWVEGADTALAGEYVIVSAHLDHLGIGPPIGGDRVYNGAVDNALGTAVMLEAARLVQAASPRRSVLFAAVTAEEQGLLGSDYLAEHPVVPRASPIANINIDMPLLFGPSRDIIPVGAEHSTLGALVERSAAAAGYTIGSVPDPGEVPFIRSDQYSFVRRGIPSLYLASGIVSADPAINLLERIEDFRRNHYHRPSDDFSRPIDYAAAGKFTRFAADTILRAANDTERPRWIPGDFFEQRFALPAAQQ